MERLWGLKPGARAPRPDGAGLLARFFCFTLDAAVKNDLTSNTQDPVAQGVSRYGRRFSRTRSPGPPARYTRTTSMQVSTASMKQAFYPGLATGVTEEYSVTLV